MEQQAKTAKEVLIAAKWLLENIGWTQGKSYDNVTRCMCATGALNKVVCQNEHYRMKARSALESVIGTHVILWNDDPYRTKDEVLAAFDKAIESC